MYKATKEDLLTEDDLKKVETLKILSNLIEKLPLNELNVLIYGSFLESTSQIIAITEKLPEF